MALFQKGVDPLFGITLEHIVKKLLIFRISEVKSYAFFTGV